MIRQTPSLPISHLKQSPEYSKLNHSAEMLTGTQTLTFLPCVYYSK